MILTRRTARVDFPPYPMKRQFCESSIMSEYHIMKPYFISTNDDVCCQDSSCLNDEIWKKFDLFPTPPNSPEHARESDTLPPKPEPVPCALSPEAAVLSDPEMDHFDELDLSLNTGDHNLNDNSYPGNESCVSPGDQKLIKDCMWNGYGHKSSVEKYKNGRSRRSSSPANSRSPCHANGCVDPRNIFPYPVGQPTCCENQRRRNRFPSPISPAARPRATVGTDGAETPSDSEEEIDVVTVESKSQNVNVLKAKNGTNRTTSGQKIMGTLVPKENGRLALLTTAAGATNFATNGLKKASEKQLSELNRGRSRSKHFHVLSGGNGQNKGLQVAMLIESKGDLAPIDESKQVELQMKTVSDDVIRRRNTTDICCGKTEKVTTAQLMMRLASPKSVMERNTSASPVSRPEGKKRGLSLDGISFSATTGVRQYTTEYNRQKECIKLPTLSYPAGGALKSAQENAINITAVRSKAKVRQAPMNVVRVKTEDDTNGVRTPVAGSPQNKRKRKAEAANSGSSGSGSDSEQIRAAHNVLERQRREGLRASFHTLRDNVPELQNMERTPKVNILNKARDHCLEIAETEKTLIAEKERLKRRQLRLQRRLQRLRESLEVVTASSDLESDVEDRAPQADSLMSPEPSLPPSLPPSPPHIYATSTGNGYIIARRLSNEEYKAVSQSEMLLRLGTSCPTNTHQNPTNQRKRRFMLSPTEYPAPETAKQLKCSPDLQSLLANFQQRKEMNFRVAPFQSCEGLSDGYEECYDSEEDGARYGKEVDLCAVY